MSKRTCEVDLCGRIVVSRNLCQMHYQRFLRHGDPMVTLRRRERPTMKLDPAVRFWRRVDRGDDRACWLWRGPRSKTGYGSFWGDDGPQRVHVFAYELLVGPVPDGLELDHTCRNRQCVNPAHLEPVTHAENMARRAPFHPGHKVTHCPQGHEYTPENLIPNRRSRECKECGRERSREYRRRKRAERKKT